MMTIRTDRQKNEFAQHLRPFFEMLENIKDETDYGDWMSMVQRTQASVLAHPEQYLGGDLSGTSTSVLVDEIFSEFLQENAQLACVD